MPVVLLHRTIGSLERSGNFSASVVNCSLSIAVFHFTVFMRISASFRSGEIFGGSRSRHCVLFSFRSPSCEVKVQKGSFFRKAASAKTITCMKVLHCSCHTSWWGDAFILRWCSLALAGSTMMSSHLPLLFLSDLCALWPLDWMHVERSCAADEPQNFSDWAMVVGGTVTLSLSLRCCWVMTFVHNGYTSVRSILSITVAEASVACTQDLLLLLLLLLPPTPPSAIVSMNGRKKKKKSEATGFAYASCVLQMSTCKFFCV